MNLILLDPSEVDGHHARITDARRLTHLHEVHRANEGDRLTVGIQGGAMGKATLTELNKTQALFSLEDINEQR